MSVASDFKIIGNTELTGSASEYRVGAQPTILRGTPAQNKQAFDNYCDMISTQHNALCDYLDLNISSEVDIDVQRYYANILGWVRD